MKTDQRCFVPASFLVFLETCFTLGNATLEIFYAVFE